MRKATVDPPASSQTVKSINGIKKWVKLELAKADPYTARFFDVTEDIDLAKFTPEWFDKFLTYKIRSTK
ncbi:hypothetical protein PHMEG_00041653 [Phytophthora megakarya]|uniref:Uncharacterized protein n=1 Tax=Phytophthora megakarya TaxID=4795 RepID=A0A225UBC7_9STRA|nr:hypothetical protein PHMEG_00041653 [Phytophthora megakarya]